VAGAGCGLMSSSPSGPVQLDSGWGAWPRRSRSRGGPVRRAAPGPGRRPHRRSPTLQTSRHPARVIICLASAGLVANAVPSGTPAARHRAGSDVQDRGRYSARPVNAAPAAAAQARYTATWAFSVRPACRCSQRGSRKLRAHRFKELFGFQAWSPGRREMVSKLLASEDIVVQPPLDEAGHDSWLVFSMPTLPEVKQQRAEPRPSDARFAYWEQLRPGSELGGLRRRDQLFGWSAYWPWISPESLKLATSRS
jgi:hypothetical protein